MAIESVYPTLEERRAKRAARREKQRQQNVFRAAKMHAERLAYPITSKRTESRHEVSYHVGCSGWFYWHWKGAFYPAEMPTSEWFEHYAGQFRTVELNAPFYSWPTVATVKTWLKQAGRKRFTYTVKVNELITHTRRFQDTAELVTDFGLIADLLGSKMGCFLFQCPPSERYSPDSLHRILGQLNPVRRNVVEFRHASWWNEHVYAAFRDTGTIFCSCSGPRLPDQLVRTADDVYLRFHGINKWYRHDYSIEELAIWVERVRTSGASRIWAYFNNDRDGYAIKNARTFLALLKRRPA